MMSRIIRMVVVFPAPFVPRKPNILPCWTSNETSSITRKSPKFLLTLSIDRVSKNFGDFRVIDDVSFDVQQGRMFGFLGTNGAGKTTTMRMILDIIRADTGTISWNGTLTSDVSRREFGYLPEERGLYPKMPVDDQLLFLAQLYGAERQAAQRSLDHWLTRLEIEENRHKRVEQLSKGNQQKIQFLAAVLHDPEVLILD